jgi:hypothetical protein
VYGVLTVTHPSIYYRAGILLSSEERTSLEAEVCSPHCVFFLDPEEVAWEDLIPGPLKYNLQNLSNPIAIREDKSIIFLLQPALLMLSIYESPIFYAERTTSPARKSRFK